MAHQDTQEVTSMTETNHLIRHQKMTHWHKKYQRDNPRASLGIIQLTFLTMLCVSTGQMLVVDYSR